MKKTIAVLTAIVIALILKSEIYTLVLLAIGIARLVAWLYKAGIEGGAL